MCQLNFKILQCENSKSKNKVFSLLLADTVIINKDKADVVTSMSSKALKDLAYSFNEDEEEEKPKSKAVHSGAEPLMSKTTLRSDNHEISRQHQAELARQKMKKLLGDLLVVVMRQETTVLLPGLLQNWLPTRT